MIFHGIVEILFYILILICGITDLIKGKVYNVLTYPAIVLGMGINIISNGFEGFKTSGLGILTGSIPLYIAFRFGGVGGGDVKFMGAIGALKGYPFSIYALFYALLAGGAISIVLLIYQGAFVSGMKNTLKTIFTAIIPKKKTHPLHESLKKTIPFGFAIALGSLWAQFEIIMKINLIDMVKSLIS